MPNTNNTLHLYLTCAWFKCQGWVNTGMFVEGTEWGNNQEFQKRGRETERDKEGESLKITSREVFKKEKEIGN